MRREPSVGSSGGVGASRWIAVVEAIYFAYRLLTQCGSRIT